MTYSLSQVYEKLQATSFENSRDYTLRMELMMVSIAIIEKLDTSLPLASFNCLAVEYEKIMRSYHELLPEIEKPVFDRVKKRALHSIEAVHNALRLPGVLKANEVPELGVVWNW